MEFFIRDGRLRPTWRVFLYLAAYLVGQLLAQIPIGIAYGAYLLSHKVEAITLEHLPLPLLTLSAVASLLAVVVITWAFRRFLDRDTLLGLGLQRSKRWQREIGTGLALGLLLMAFIFGLEWTLGWVRVQGFAWHRQPPMTLIGILLGYASFYILVAFSEELAFRGYILQNLREEWGTLVALLASSFLFALLHGLNPHFTPLALMGIALAGVFMAYGYLVTGSLWLPIAFHFAWNFAQGPLFSFPVSGLASEGLLLVERADSPSLITGGAFGPEGGLLGMIALLLGLLLLWLWWRGGA
jgi:membrane protease YdiL (CAAX protease family)